MDHLLNVELLDHNECFGCGHENPRGLHIQVHRSDPQSSQLRGAFYPDDSVCGFPGITHGGALFTAMDCMASWTARMMRSENAIWILRSADISFQQPALSGNAVELRAELTEQGGNWEAVTVRVQAVDTEGTLLTEATFKEVPITTERFLAITGAETLPENWRRFINTEEGGHE